VQDEVDRCLVRGQADRPQDRLGIVDVDEAEERHAEDADRLLAVDHRDHPRAPRPLQRGDGPRPAGSQEPLADDR
jgi:hypothetical protein